MDVPQIIVIGIGSTLRGDDGAGPYAVEKLKKEKPFPDNVELYDGGATGMMGLLPLIEEADHLIIIDSVKMKDSRPGEVKKFSLDGFKKVIPKKLSAHDVGFMECITIAEINGRLPDTVCIIGINPEKMDEYSMDLSETVETKIPLIVSMAIDEIEALCVRDEIEQKI